jgi:hypothetical protein
MHLTFDATNYLLVIAFLGTTVYSYWLIGEAERQSRRQQP